jgi:Leucine-rich repeat (LRR) protein
VKTLRINRNLITTIPSQISSLPLTILDISYNTQITSLPSTFNQLTKLTTLSVVGDSLNCESLTMISQMTSITSCSGCTPLCL